MPRMHLSEWEDQPWLPVALRDFITDHLREAMSAPGAAPLRNAVAEILAPSLERSGETTIVDVCSGAGGPLVPAMPEISARLGKQVRLRLTDLFPNEGAFRAIEQESGGLVSGEPSPVSAFDVPENLGRYQTICTALHHFRPDDAARILADAVRKRRTIAVIEPFNRKSLVPTTIGGLLVGILRTPFMEGMTVSRLLWTYPVPVAPMILAWDGMVSCLRAYTADELLAMARSVSPDYSWQSGETMTGGPFSVTWLIGEPPETAGLR